MKAAVLENYGELPVYRDIDAPVPSDASEILVRPLASSVKNLDKGKASGQHYTDFGELPAVMGMDGVVRLSDGSRAWTMGTDQLGMMAEQAVVSSDGLVKLPDALDASLAAVLPNALMGSDLALMRKGRVKPGDVVLVNGATGNTGMLAVQMAKYRGASAVIATGRNSEKLAKLRQLGADVTIDLTQPDTELVKQLTEVYKLTPFDIVLDYLWGKPAELVFEAVKQLKPLSALTFVTIGNMAGAEISLPSQLLRSRDLTLVGSGIGAINPRDIQNYFQAELPEIFNYAAAGNITLPLNEFPLSAIQDAWQASQAVVRIND